MLVFIHPFFHGLVGFHRGLFCTPLCALDQLLCLVTQLLGRFLAVNCLGANHPAPSARDFDDLDVMTRSLR